MKDFLCFSNAVQKCHSFELQGLRSSTQSIMLENLLHTVFFISNESNGTLVSETRTFGPDRLIL